MSSATTEAVIRHHLAASAAADLEAVMFDYADDAVVISPASVLRGAAEIRAFFTQFFRDAAHLAAGLQLQQLVVEGEVAYIMFILGDGSDYRMQCSDTYVLRGGKIAVETVISVPLEK